jgi:alkylation response protein AidB-like acyl-CoA dehydrogenase
VIAWLRGYARDRINSRLIDERRCIPPHVVLDFGNRGVMGLQVSQGHGGLGLGHRDAMRVVEQLAAIDLALATFAVNHNFLGIGPIQQHATGALREELLPVLAQGRELAAFALTEPGAGSNPQSMSASGACSASGAWTLRGTKLWSGSASWAGAINVFVKVREGEADHGGITAFTVRAGTPGLSHGPEAATMGMRGMVQNVIRLDGVCVPTNHLLGSVGLGMDVAQEAMAATRLAIAAKSLGAMKRSLQLMHRYASRRSIATGRLLDNPVTLNRISDSTAATTALEALATTMCEQLDQGKPVPAEAYMASKNAGAELLWEAADRLVQILGGRGYIETNIAPQILRDARIFRIFEGPTETLNMFLGLRVLYQGAAVERYLCDTLGAPAVWKRLNEAAGQVNARLSSDGERTRAQASSSRWAYALTGELAVYAILWAAAERAMIGTVAPAPVRAVDWAWRRFEATLTRALSHEPVETSLDVDRASDTILGYAETIGDIEQTLPGEDHEIDSFLRR